MPTMQLPKLKLVHKGLILISIPMVFGFGTLAICESMLQSYRHVRNQAVFTTKISERVTVLNGTLSQLEKNVADVSGSPPQSQRLESIAAIAKSFTQQLKQLSSTMLNYSEHNDVYGFAFVPRAKHSPFAGRNLKTLESDWNQVQDELLQPTPVKPSLISMGRLHNDLYAVLGQELEWNSAASKEADRRDQTVQQALAFWLLCNVLICPFLVLYFSQSLLKRLNILIENSNRLAEGKELVSAEAGDDELASADAVFRSMSSKLKAAEQAQRDFVAMINHDIRTPLNALQATLQLLSEGVYGELTTDGVKRTQAAQEIADELIALVNQLLDLEKVKSGKVDLKVQSIALHPIVEKAIGTLYGIASFKSLSMVNECAPDVLLVADENRLAQVLVNLLANAAKFAPESSKILVECERLANDQVEIRVIDEGSGIPVSMDQEVFEPFSQLNSDMPGIIGTGLGLAICKQIIEAHQGTIGVRRNVMHGSTFWFRLRSPVRVISPPPEIEVHEQNIGR